MLERDHVLTLSDELIAAVQSRRPVDGLTHAMYRYPARFSPEFARAAIMAFSEPGDVILDPFMGGGTTLVESMANQRRVIGADISTLAQFVTKAKTTILDHDACERVHGWGVSIGSRITLRRPAIRQAEWAEAGYQRGIPWPLRKTVELILAEAETMPTSAERSFIRCVVLQTAQWALDCTTTFPPADAFREQFARMLRRALEGMADLREQVARMPTPGTPAAICLNAPAADLNENLWADSIRDRPRLVVTSPPYPGVHVLYHRWQIKGRREVPAPFWIAGGLDGNGASYYTMGSRTPTGLDNYFAEIERSFSRIHGLLADDAIVVQLIAFANIAQQLPRYLIAMQRAGFAELSIEGRDAAVGDKHMWRKVPSRRWYASLQGDTPSSNELLLIHRRVAV